MKLQSFSVPIAVLRHGVPWTLLALVTAVTLVASNLNAAQMDALGVPITIPGTEISGWGRVDELPARFGLPARLTPKVPAVLILHGSDGVDGRGAFYAKALQEAGFATLEIIRAWLILVDLIFEGSNRKSAIEPLFFGIHVISPE